MLPSEKQFIDRMKNLGVRLTDRVICYDTHSMQWWGYRAAWMFQVFGHPRVQVLDGGLEKWVKEGRPIEANDETVKD